MNLPREILFLLGPTGTCKSDAAVKIALEQGYEIVNCDSHQVYQDLNVGTAKPTNEQQGKVPHHLYSFVAVGEQFTAGQYRKAALNFLSEKIKQNKTRFLFVGGSGFYVHALNTEMYPVGAGEGSLRETVVKDFSEKGPAVLFAELNDKDPTYAKKIGPNDHYRMQRALEILRAGHNSVSDFQSLAKAQSKNPLTEMGFQIKKMGLDLDKSILKERLALRAQAMINAGLIDETKAFIEKGFKDWRPLNSVGYKEVQQYIAGTLAYENLVDAIVLSSMQLSKRQRTWFKKDREIKWEVL